MKLQKKLIRSLILVLTLLASACGGDDNKIKVDDDAIEFHYSFNSLDSTKGYIYYSDDYFKVPSTTYQPSLSTASLCFSMASFARIIKYENGDRDYSKQYSHIEELLNNLNFSNFETNDDFKIKPKKDTLGVAIANKKIDDFTLIAVAVRGANYESEWASNVLIGPEGNCKGFDESKDIYLSSLSEYINNNNISGKVKIWTASYSRGASVVNLAIGDIDEALSKGSNIINEKISYSKEDIYAYCFEPPASKYYVDENDYSYIKGTTFSNIHNVINPSDAIPMLFPKQYNIARFGNEYYTTGIFTDNNYEEFKKRVVSFYSQMDGYESRGDNVSYNFKFYKFKDLKLKEDSEGKLSFSGGLDVIEDTSKVNWTPSLFCSYISEKVFSSIITRDVYSSMDEGVSEIVDLLIYNNPNDVLSFLKEIGTKIITSISLLTKLLNNREAFYEEFNPYLKEKILSLDPNANTELMLATVKDVLELLIKVLLTEEGLNVLATFIGENNFNCFANAHYQELELAQLMAMDEKYGKKVDCLKQEYNIVKINRFSNIIIRDNDGIISKIKNKEFVLEDTKVVSYLDNNELVYYLPSDKEYTIEVEDGARTIEIYKHKTTVLNDTLVASYNTQSGDYKVNIKL